MADDDVTIRMRLQGALKTAAETRKVADEVDNLGDQAKQAARRLRDMNAASKNTRVSLGPFSTSLKGGILALGAFAHHAGPATAGVIGLTEAASTAVGGAAGAGGVGLLGFAQGMGVVKLATQGVSEALSGNKKAIAALSPEQRRFVDQLNNMRPLLDRLRSSASGGLLRGLGGGAHAAAANFGIVNRIARQTSGVLGGLAGDAGGILGSKGFGADLSTVGTANVRIIDNLGHSTLNLAEAAEDLLVEAAPLAEWLSRMALTGSENAKAWADQARAGGDLTRFFRNARRDLTLLGSIGGHGARGILNLFGASDVDGTKTLASLDRISARFERWTNSPAVRHGVGESIITGIGELGGALAKALAHEFVPAGFTAGRLFVKAFFSTDVWGKALIAGLIAKKLGAFGAVGKLLAGGTKAGKAGGVVGKLIERGSSPANPLFVVDVSSSGGKGWLKTLENKAKGPVTAAAGAAAGRSAALRAALLAGARTGGPAGATALALDQVGREVDRRSGGGFTANAHNPILNPQRNALQTLGDLLGAHSNSAGLNPAAARVHREITIKIGEKVVAKAVDDEHAHKRARK